MADIHRKKLLFMADIRKKYLQEKFKEIREDVTISREIEGPWAIFMKEQPNEVPAICLSHEKYLTEAMLQPFLSLLMNNELQLIRTNKNVNTWLFDCTSEVNLKFMTKICQQIQNCCRLAGFFNATVEASQPFANFFDKIPKQFPSCFIDSLIGEQDERDSLSITSYLNSKEGSKVVAALIGFWHIYLQMSQQPNSVSNFVTILKAFQLFLEESDIYHQKETYLLVLYVCQLISKLKIFKPNDPNGFITKFAVIENSMHFLQNLKKKMEYMLKVNVEFNLNYPEVGQILLELSELNKDRPGIFFEVVCHSNYCKNYIFGLLTNQENSYMCKLTALKLINKLQMFNLLKIVLYLEGVLNATRILAYDMLFDPLYCNVTSIILYNMVEDDRDRNLSLIFQQLDYQNVFDLLQSSTDEDLIINLLDILVKALQVYSQNQIISDKILENGNLETFMRTFYRQREDQSAYGFFVQIIMRNIQFYMMKHRGMVLEMWHQADSMNFKGLEQFIKKVQQFEEMRLTNRTL